MRHVVVAVACAALAYADERVLRSTHADTVHEFEDISRIIHDFAPLDELKTDAERRTIVIKGTDRQVTTAEWLFSALQRSTQDSWLHYQPRPWEDQIIAVFFLQNARTIQDLQVVTSVVRSTIEIADALTCSVANAFVVRGTTDQIEAAKWLTARLDQAGRVDNGVTSEQYRMKNDPQGAIRVLRVSSAVSAYDLQDLSAVTRATAEVRRAFVYPAQRALALRSTEEVVAAAEWVFRTLVDKDPERRHECRRAGGIDEVIRIFFPRSAGTHERLVQLMMDVRDVTRNPRGFVYRPANAILMRGTASEMAWAEKLIAERD